MASPATPKLVKAEVRFTWAEQQVENRLHFLFLGTEISPGDLSTLATTIDNSVLALWLDLMSVTVTFREIYIETYEGTESQSFTLSSGGVGSVVGDSMAPQNAFCLSLRTALTGRARRGRFYTIGMAEASQAAGVVTSGYRTGWIDALTSLKDEALSNDWQLSVASFFTGGEERLVGVVTPITAIIAVDDFVDSQRRRARGRGI